MYAVVSPFSKVLDKILVARNVTEILSTIKNVKNIPETKLSSLPMKTTVTSEMRVVIIGNLPLQGTNDFVSMASIRSRFESIIRHPVTPTALQPNPIHIVRACFPQLLHYINGLSRLNATLGRYPASSKNVKSGKKIAIGGSITATTQKGTRSMPTVTAYCSSSLAPK